MCGVTGFWQSTAFDPDDALRTVTRMAAEISYRGPDDAGAWVDADAGIALGHRRLSIVDLSAAGHQPMASASGRYILAYNGEIYNHADLRLRLERESRQSLPWRGHSDTETLLAGFETWGMATTLQEAIGMFAFALWDRQTRCLTLARDRIGEKPLYYGWVGSGKRTLLFGSELKALRAHPSFSAQIDREALLLFMRHGYVPAPWTIHQGIRKLAPGTTATLRSPTAEPELMTYWSAADVMLRGHASPLQADPRDAVEQLDTLLKDAVRRQMVADVPLGAFLSGGFDSSTIVALMQAQSTRPVRTFSIGFHEQGYDEAQHAKAVAAHLGTDHTELYVTPEQALEVVPQLPAMYDEPFADSSQIPTHLVAKLARRHVTVALSGDAGDELFCGYPRYSITQRMWSRVSAIPRPLRAAVAKGIALVPEATWDRVAARIAPIWPSASRYGRIGAKLHKGARAMIADTSDALYLRTVSQWSDPAPLMPGVREPQTLLTGARTALHGLPDVPRMMAYDLLTYLPDDILVKVDRAAMAVSLETRVPMLDHRVVEFAWRLPHSMKLRGDCSKWILRQVLDKYVPRGLVERPKMGFGVPIDTWLRGPLSQWGEALLDSLRQDKNELLAFDPVRRAWSDHQSGRANLQYPLWNVLMFQAWREAQP